MNKIRKCKKCGKEIGAKVLICPECGTHNPLPIYKHWLFWVLLVLFLIGINNPDETDTQPMQSDTGKQFAGSTETKEITSRGDTKADDKEEIKASTPAKETTTKKTNQVKDLYLLGEVAELGKLNIQVLNVEHSQGSKYVSPKDGCEYTIVKLAIKNTSDKTLSYNGYHFSLKNGNGQIETQTFTFLETDQELNFGELAPSGLVTGGIIFETPKDDNDLKLIYENKSVINKSVVFDICESMPSFEPMKSEKITLDSSLSGIGETVTLNNMNVTVERIERTQGDSLYTPKDGNEYVIVYITLENIGKKNQDYNPLDFKLQNSTGTQLDRKAAAIDKDTNMSYGELASGGKFTSSIVFEAPEGDTELGLIYRPSVWSDKEIIIRLK